MKVRVRQTTPQFSVDEVFAGATADEVVAAMQKRVVSQLALPLRLFASALSPLSFAQEVANRYGQGVGRTLPKPKTCAEFLELGQQEGIVTILER